MLLPSILKSSVFTAITDCLIVHVAAIFQF